MRHLYPWFPEAPARKAIPIDPSGGAPDSTSPLPAKAKDRHHESNDRDFLVHRFKRIDVLASEVEVARQDDGQHEHRGQHFARTPTRLRGGAVFSRNGSK